MEADHQAIKNIGIVTLVFVLVTTLILSGFIWYTNAQMQKAMTKVNKLTDSTRIAAMVASGAKGFTEGLGAAIASVTCRAPYDLKDIPPLDKKHK